MTTTSAPAPPRRRTLLPWLVAAAVLVTAAARVAYLVSPVMQFNADEATTGIMVRRILAGHGYVFYAGQQYGGALEQYLEAAVYAVTRLPQNPLTLRLPLGNGILTVETQEQAEARARVAEMNKGGGAAEAALAVLALKRAAAAASVGEE